MLRKAYGEEIIVEPLYKILGNIVIELEEKKITDERFFAYLRSLFIQGTAFIIDENLLYKLDRLDDAYYLAKEKIYSDVLSVCEEAIKDLKYYKKFAHIFEEA